MSEDTSVRLSRPRIIALRAAVVIFLVVGLAGLGPALVLPFIAWLPEESLIEFGLPEDDIGHLIHGVGAALVYGALLLSVAVQLRRPQRWVAPLWLAMFLLGAQACYDLARLTIDDPTWFVVYGLFAAVVMLHPRRLARISAVDRPALILAVAAAAPLGVFAWQRLELQIGPPDPFGHAADNHYYGMAALAAVVIVAALLGSTDLPGWRLTAWVAGVAAALFGIASLVHPAQESALASPWAAAAIVWAAVYLAMVWLRGRRSRVPSADAQAASSGV
jgi:hypothetical protein